jgi:lysophospholipase L1-like esterase
MLMTTVAVLGLVALCLVWAPCPYFWAFLFMAFWFVRSTVWCKKHRVARVILMNCAVVAVLLAAFEGGLSLYEWLEESRNPLEMEYSKKFFSFDPELGNVPRQSADATCTKGDTLVYDVHYSINENHLRATPDEGREKAPAVVFFGCSNTFGEGVQDDENFPYRLAESLGTDKRVINLAFSGYGTNHMLAWLQCSRLEPALEGSTPETVFYVFIKDHVRRATGHVRWAARSPRFTQTSDGSFKREGMFLNPELSMPYLKIRTRWEIDRSAVMRRIFPYKRTDEALRFWADMVEESKNQAREKWPEAKFVALFFWYSKNGGKMVKLLEEREIEVICLTDFLPELEEQLIPNDGHPNAEGHRMVADFLAKKLAAEQMSGKKKKPAEGADFFVHRERSSTD